MIYNSSAGRQTALGVTAAVIAAVIWSSWTVVSKMGVSAELAPQDLAAIRFGISGLCSVPAIVYSQAFRTISISRVLALAATGGIPYVLLLYFGFEFAPASHAGVLVNGFVPAITIGYRWASTSLRPKAGEVAGAFAILAGVTLVVAGADGTRGSYIGDLMFLGAAFLFAGFLSLSSKWKVGPTQTLLALSVVGALIYLPVWLLIMPKTLLAAQPSSVLLQALYQGLLAPLVGMLLISQATARCGPVAVATVLSSVPALSAILAALWLGERVSIMNWVGIGIATAGIRLTLLGRQRASQS